MNARRSGMMMSRGRCLMAVMAMVVVAAVLSAGVVLAGPRAQAWAAETGLQGAELQATFDADYYAVLHDNGELVFQAHPSDQANVTNFEGSCAPYASGKAPWLASADLIESVRFDESFAGTRPESLAFWFTGCKNLQTIDLQNLDASASTSMRSMFSGCSSLATIEHLESFDTSSSTYFGSMFRDCSSLTSLDVSHFDATHVGVLCFMFNGCTKLETLNMAGEGWRTSSLYLMVHVWENCTSLKSLDLSYLDTSGVRSMASDFNGCSSLERLDLSGADTTNVATLTHMFDGCSELTTVKLGPKFTFSGKASAPQCSLPDGLWKSSATGTVYKSANVPSNTADTYTRVPASDDKPTGDPVADPAADDEESAAEKEASDKPASDKPAADKPAADKPAAEKQEAAAKKITKVTVNVKTVNAKAIASAISAAGGNAKYVKTITLGKKVQKVAKAAFKRTKATKIVVKTSKLNKKSVAGSLKSSKVKTLKVKVGKAKANKKYATKYKSFFTKKNAGKSVRVTY